MRYAPPDLAKLDILLVEDDAFQRRLTVQALRTLGCERVTAVEDGVQALDHLARERCALVLSDVHMPRMNGLDLLREIRAGRAGVQRDLRVILLTSFSNTEVLGAAMALDVNGFLVKPLRKDLIADRVAMALGERMHLRIGAAYAVVKTELAMLQAADETVPPEDEPLPRHALPPLFSRAAKAGVTERQIAADQLEPGMRLTRDVRSRDGHVLIARGQTLTDGNVNRLNDLRSLIDDGGIWVADTPPAVPGGTSA